MPELNEQVVEPNPGDAGLPPPVNPDNGGAPEGGVSGPDVVAPPKSLRDTIIAARDEVRAKQGDDRPRDPATGKFAPKTAETAPKAAPLVKEASPQAPVEAKPADLSGPPANWSADKKAAWSDLTSLQKAAIKREEEITNGISQYQQRQKEFEGVIAPYRQYFADQNLSDTQATKIVWDWFGALQSNPEKAFPALAQTFGFDLNNMVNAGGNGAPQPSNPIDPRLFQELTGVKTQVSQLQQFINQQEQQRVAQDLATFGKDKPHFENQAIKTAMGHLLRTGLADSLDNAYQQAIWANPEIRAQLLADQRKTAEQEAAKTALQRVPTTRTTPQRASVSPRSMSPNGSAAPAAKPSGSVRESIMRAIEASRN